MLLIISDGCQLLVDETEFVCRCLVWCCVVWCCVVLCGLVWSQFDQTLTLVAWHAVSISIGFQCRFSVSVGEEPREGFVSTTRKPREKKNRDRSVSFLCHSAQMVLLLLLFLRLLLLWWQTKPVSDRQTCQAGGFGRSSANHKQRLKRDKIVRVLFFFRFDGRWIGRVKLYDRVNGRRRGLSEGQIDRPRGRTDGRAGGRRLNGKPGEGWRRPDISTSFGANFDADKMDKRKPRARKSFDDRL